MSNFKQTWWDNNLPTRYDEFAGWVGAKNAPTKEYFRWYVYNKKYKSLIDLGCGNATEYFAYKEEYPELSYLGVDSSKILYNRNVELGVPMLWVETSLIPLPDGHSEVVFSRHVLEHQPSFQLLLSEMIRLASKEAIHVFFITPGDTEIIHYDEAQNLYHNTFSKKAIEAAITIRKDVESFEWIPLTETETALSIIKKAPN